MTAYSRASQDTPFGRFCLEIHSVNRRGLDLSLYLPKDFLRFDMAVRKWLSKELERGQVTVKLNITAEEAETRLLATYLPQLKSLKRGWDKIALELGLTPDTAINLPFLVSQMQPVSLSEGEGDEEKIRGILRELVEEALKELLQRKEEEGKALEQDMNKRLKTIEEEIEGIEGRREDPLAKYRQRLENFLKESGLSVESNDERLLKEVALLAEKTDVTEEIVRLKTHIASFRRHIRSNERAIGKTLDFVVQEMHREINTLGSKSLDSTIAMSVIKVKSELEKIREQVQNIE